MQSPYLLHNHIYYLGPGAQPTLELWPAGEGRELSPPQVSSRPARVPMTRAGEGRRPGETLWLAELPPLLGSGAVWDLRIERGDGSYDAPSDGLYRTALRSFWLQDGQLFDYRPAPEVSPSRVIKHADFTGSLPPRPLYIYLPRGYAEHTGRHYPVLYMHDGQNVFEAYAADSFAGSWKADQTADQLIKQGLMRECLIVGVSHGGPERIAEYLPPYVTIRSWPLRLAVARGWKDERTLPLRLPPPIGGRADHTLAYYRDEVAPYIRRNYRVLSGREHSATCGSSMGGVFSLYAAWECPKFARHHAALSPALSLTCGRGGHSELIERLRTDPRRDLRLWLDSGTLDRPNHGDDGMVETLQARDALLANGYQPGPDFHYYLDQGTVHNESAWAARLPMVFRFLFPTGRG